MNKIIYTVLFCMSLSFFSTAQSAGDIIFVGLFTDDQEAFSFLVVNALPGDTKIYFTDDEWNGLDIGYGGAFNSTTEGYVEWLTPVGGVDAGTIVVIQDGADTNNSPDDVASIGTIVRTDRQMILTGHDENLYAFIGSDVNTPSAFLAGIFNSRATDSGNNINGTGLTLGVDALEFIAPGGFEDADDAMFNFTGSTCQIDGVTEACLTEIRDLSNWTFENGSNAIISVLDIPTQLLLPVDFLSFDAHVKGETVELNWQTSFEINNDFISIERSKDAKKFEEIGHLLGAGTTSEIQSYRFTDQNPLEGATYYRLRQVDFDGAFSYSPIVKVSIQSINDDLTVYPNPTEDYIQLPELKSGSTVRIFSVQGQLLRSVQMTDSQKLSMLDFPKGMYLLQSDTDGQVQTAKVFKL